MATENWEEQAHGYALIVHCKPCGMRVGLLAPADRTGVWGDPEGHETRAAVHRFLRDRGCRHVAALDLQGNVMKPAEE